jgi:hypothetical protein
VINPPYKRAQRFLEKALADARYVALLLRSNFLLEGVGRTELLDRQHPPTRVWTADLRLPMMPRAGWTGKRASSNTAYSWVIWDERANAREFPRRFNWREICALPGMGGLALMGEKTSIDWTDSTLNPWIGCTNVSPGCDHCYAEALSARFKLAEWGPANAPVLSDTETTS